MKRGLRGVMRGAGVLQVAAGGLFTAGMQGVGRVLSGRGRSRVGEMLSLLAAHKDFHSVEGKGYQVTLRHFGLLSSAALGRPFPAPLDREHRSPDL